MKAEEYLKDRVGNQIAYYQKSASQCKRIFVWMQTLIIILGVLVPLVVNLPHEWFGEHGDLAIRGTVTVLSFLLAVLSSILGFRKFDELWQSYRGTEELLKHEKFLFLTNSGTYENNDQSFPVFVERAEAIISSEHNTFVKFVDEAKKPSSAEDKEKNSSG